MLDYLSTLPMFLLWLAVMAALMGAFAVCYSRFVTPLDELKLIREGNVAAALSFTGAKLGFVAVLVVVSSSAASLLDLVIWSAIGLVVQMGAFLLARMLHKDLVAAIERGSVAAGIWLMGFNLTAGLIQAACMIY